MFYINFYFSSYYERINSHNAIQYYFMNVNLVSNPFNYFGFTDDDLNDEFYDFYDNDERF